MESKIISNNKKNNHFNILKKMSLKADTLIIVSPFIADDLSKIIENMPTIKMITIYTTLEKYDDEAHKIIKLYAFYNYCRDIGIKLSIKIDDNLHGKVYLFYKGVDEKGFVLTSGNFTENGLINNHEYGLFIDDCAKQREMAEIIFSVNTYDLSFAQLNQLNDEALKFIKKNPIVKNKKFKISQLINKKPSVTQNERIKYYLKPIGTSKDPFLDKMTVKETEYFGFGKKPNTMNFGDVLLLHSVGTSCIVGYYVVISEEAVYLKYDEFDRWPWKVKSKCHSLRFSADWWSSKLKTQELVNQFLIQKPGNHITYAGGDTLGGLQWGRDKLQITKEFAHFIIDKMAD